jgi:hypothetical protein
VLATSVVAGTAGPLWRPAGLPVYTFAIDYSYFDGFANSRYNEKQQYYISILGSRFQDWYTIEEKV